MQMTNRKALLSIVKNKIQISHLFDDSINILIAHCTKTSKIMFLSPQFLGI